MKKIIILAMTVFLTLLLAGLFMPKDYHSAYQVEISAPALQVYQKINDIRTWMEWGVWNEPDSQLKVTLGETTQGAGAQQFWQSPTGSGHILITKSEPQHITYDVDYMAGTLKSFGEFLIEKKGDQASLVTWNTWGRIDNPIVGGYIAKFMEIMNRQATQKSLENLKASLENPSGIATQPEALE